MLASEDAREGEDVETRPAIVKRLWGGRCYQKPPKPYHICR
jgi:hypothetical protein